ncbi:MAG: tRNA (adenosine(37)-N6)-threonylcarbamoyltransferase complex dimerization subunit type 1 TsaB [Paracoccaceae bacterium]|nr:tRNA (adenosine(37)-N6)-threonylcarbamoyltransferase complex dimerization subunit type 1 TsaB [Paracoccaceae bacterium]
MFLAFDTSGAYVSAALYDGHAVIAAADEEMARGQAERLMPLLQELLDHAGLDWQSLTALGVGIGPGNFTGIRLSVAAARGLALGLGIPAVGVSLLEALELDSDGPVLTCIAAPRESAYVQGHRMAADIPAQQIAFSEVPKAWAEPGLRVIGSASPALSEALGCTDAPAQHAPAQAIARIAAREWQNNPPRPAPLYLRAADAAPSRDLPPVILDDA